MSENKQGDTQVEIIVPPNPLKSKVGVSGSGSLDFGPIERAEKALEQLSVEFDDWLSEEVDLLLLARDRVIEEGLTAETQAKLYLASHDLKGQAETYGYPLITRVCASLCKLLDTATQRSLIPAEIIDHHVNAVRNMMKYKMKSTKHPQGSAVTNKLIDVVLEFADFEDKKRAKLKLDQK